MLSRRHFLASASLAPAALCAAEQEPILSEFGYGEVELAPGPAQAQFEQTQSVLLSLNDDSLLKPWRLRAGLPAPGPEMGGWYDELPLSKTESGGHGFAPAHCFGQWISALSRGYAINRRPETKAKLARLLALYEPAISGKFYSNFRFPAYNYDKMVIGLLDADRLAGMPSARRLLEQTTDVAEPHLPPTALDRDEPQRSWRRSVGENTGDDYTWDESYTLPENLYLAWKAGAGERYHRLASRFLLDRTYFDPLSENRNVLANHHAYSFCNALSSAMQAYIADGSVKHLRAASNAFDMITATQSFATGGWGPNESFSAPGSGALYASLTETHRGFETPCGSYAHAKLTRYLLRVTRHGRYGDSLERVLYNTVFGAMPLEPDGRAFYYSDYNALAKKTYFNDAWPCCSGTLPQVAADYRVMIYFRDAQGVFVNLYLPSTLKWTAPDGAECTWEQSGKYPFDGAVKFSLRLSRPSEFSLRLRIPAWSQGAQVRLNGKQISAPVKDGFASIRRRWQDGDRLNLDLPLPLRLEPIDGQHADTVALARGPLVLFPTGEKEPKADREQLLSAQKTAEREWRVEGAGGAIKLQPFTELQDQPYRTYVKAAL